MIFRSKQAVAFTLVLYASLFCDLSVEAQSKLQRVPQRWSSAQ